MALGALALAGCAPTGAPGPTTGPDAVVARWWHDLGAHEEQRQRFLADARQLHEEYLELRADPSYAGAEARVRDLAARNAAGERVGGGEFVVRSLYTFSLGELTVFQRLLPLSTRVATLQATRSELEAQRMDLRFRRFELERPPAGAAGMLGPAAPPGTAPALVDEPVPWPLACEHYPVGNLVLVSCR